MKLILIIMFVTTLIATVMFTMLTRALLAELGFARQAAAERLVKRRRG